MGTLESTIPDLLLAVAVSPEKYVECLNGILMVLKNMFSFVIFESVLFLPPSFKLFPSDLLLVWSNSFPNETSEAIKKLCENIKAQHDSVDSIKVC